ncbi:MAG: DUF3313 family protein [Pseudomonadales bacterium]
MSLYKLVGTVVLATLVAGCQTAPSVQTGPNAEITFDGLHRVDNSKMQYAWVKPDMDLTGYTKIRLVGAGIEYRNVRNSPGGTSRVRSSQTDFPVNAKARAMLEELVREVFLDELGKSKHYSLVNEEGPDVLEITGALLDVVSNVPPQAIGRTEVYLSRIGEITLVLEFRDSESNEILARGVDRRGVDPVMAVRSTSVSSRGEVKRELRKWAVRLREGIDSFH